MNQIISAKLKLHTTPEQFQALRKAQLAYRYVSQYAFAHNKRSNQRALQKQTYDEIRAMYGLPSQMACNVPRQVSATYKGLWTKVKQNAEHRKAGHTKKRYKSLDKPVKYVSHTLTYNYGYDYTSKDNRTNKGLLFVCQSCHYSLHADLVGARNVALRTMLVRQAWTSTGVLSVRPDDADNKAKAAHLLRYAELRWSPASSLSL
jgi:hypothetical protein